MITHHIQKRIIANLVECETARYRDIKPDNIEGNVFTYHLQTLIAQKLVSKQTDGTYSLTAKGKLYAINNSLKADELLEQAHSIILLSIRNNDTWLLRKRLVQPQFGKVGFIHGEPLAGESVASAGQRILEKRTGLSGESHVRGFGYIHLRDASATISYTAFTLLEVSNLCGELHERDEHGENAWYDKPDFTAENMIPSMNDMVSEIRKPGLFFLDKTYNVNEEKGET